MSIYDFSGYLAQPRMSLGGELIGFNKKTGRPVFAAAGVGRWAAPGRVVSAPRRTLRGLSGPDGIGSYSDLSTDFYQTYQHENWQHPGSEGWSSANMPGWGENPMLQMFPRLAVHGLGVTVAAAQRERAPTTTATQAAEATAPPSLPAAPPEESWFQKHGIWPAVVSGVLIAVVTGVTISALNKRGVPAE